VERNLSVAGLNKVNVDRAKRIGSILAHIVGPEAITGFIFGLLEEVTPEICLEYIRGNKYILKPNDIKPYKGFADLIKYIVEYEDAGIAVKKLADERPDLAGIIINHPHGLEWLQAQIDAIIKELTTED